MTFGGGETLPLFPLDVVLFPGMVLPLHIFEPRYRRMVQDCTRDERDFGLLWTDDEELIFERHEPLVETRATINNVESLADGCYNLKAIGVERFIVRDVSHEAPYLVGHVAPYPLTDMNSPRVERLVAQLRPLFARYLGQLSLIAGQNIGVSQMPANPEVLAFLVAVLYQAQNFRKQELLAIESLPRLLAREVELLRIENPLLERQLERQVQKPKDSDDDQRICLN